mmetsp:Transcript_13845/g.25424  ORF Transcript_13845/g.25424 Transcript_13845/m.25424 type:complete len:205 (+) Transcript_13845:379-993(+)
MQSIPHTRTSKPVSFAAVSHICRVFRPTSFNFSPTFSLCCFRMVAKAAAKPSRSVQKRDDKKVSWAACITGPRPTIAPIGTPLDIALAYTAMSGETPASTQLLIKCNPPTTSRKPQVISSQIRRHPYCSWAAFKAAKNSADGYTLLCVSTITAARLREFCLHNRSSASASLYLQGTVVPAKALGTPLASRPARCMPSFPKASAL